MTNVAGHDWKMEFARSAAYRAEQVRFFKEVDRRHKEIRAADRVEDDVTDLAATAAVTMATDIQIAEFRTELDDYRTATVESLMEDERQLAEIRERIDAKLAQAYVLPDGRRVFKFKDGVRVIDEHGEEVGAEVIDPDMIENWRPHADGYVADRTSERDVMVNRERKIDLLERIDRADERLDKGDLTTDDLAEMRKELEQLAPEDIGRSVFGDDYRPPIKLGGEFGAAAAKVGAHENEFTGDMTATTTGPQAPIPGG